VGERFWFSVLGPVRAWYGAAELKLGPPQQRATLAALLLSEGSRVSLDELIDAVWGDDSPRSAVQAIRTYIHRLRRILEPEGARSEPVITLLGNGYSLRTSPEEFDLAAFRNRVSHADAARRTKDFADAAVHLSEGLALWRGTALAGVPGAYAEIQRANLDKLRLSAVEAQLINDLELGAFGDATVRLSQLVADNPLDERFREMLMFALYRSGRQAEALGTFHEARHLLGEELGIDPGPGLQALHERILRADPELLGPDSSAAAGSGLAGVATGARPPRSVPAQLPADLSTFVGRGSELAQATKFLPTDGQPPATVVISAIAGMAGIGKTTLAVHWAHRVAHQFPDGQLYLNLRGFEPTGTVMEPAEAIRTVLLALDIPPPAIPIGLDAQAAYYRSLLAKRRVLIVLDNARDADQVRPLLPGAPGCLVIVTSRNRLSSLVARDGAYPLALDLLSSDEALDFLGRRLGAERIATEPRAAMEIVECCAGLPLALAIVSARAVIHPGFPLSEIAAELRDSKGSLDAFAGVDAAIDTRTVFSWSYEALTPDAARLFRLLALHPGPDLVATAAASLTGMSLRQVRLLLAELTRAHLVTEHSLGRYSSHDLLRAYSAELVEELDSPADRDTALHRMLDHFLHSAYVATSLLYPREDGITVEPVTAGALAARIADTETALAWLTTEYPVLTALITQAHEAGFHTHVWKLAWTVSDFLQRQGHWAEQVSTQLMALDATRRLGDPGAQAHAHRSLGAAYSRQGDFEAASTHLENSRALFAAIGDPAGQARTHRGIAFVSGQCGDFEEALRHCELALELYQKADDSVGQASAFNDIGYCHALLERYEEALDYCQRALALFRELGNHDGVANTWDSIGYVHHHLGDYGQAVSCYQQAIDSFRDLGDRYNEADSLTHLGDTHEATGDTDAAHADWEAALVIFEEFKQPAAAKIRVKLGIA
jgi:DNA-binding SARP family transcriptional activator